MPSWLAKINLALEKTTAPNKKPRLAVLGIGNVLNGDDGAGVHTIYALRANLADLPHLFLVEAGLAPENFTGPLRRFKPDLILMVDASWMEAAPGSIEVVDWSKAQGFSASTHSLPLSIVCDYMQKELGCPILLLCIQAYQTETLTPLHPAVQDAIEQIASGIKDLV